MLDSISQYVRSILTTPEPAEQQSALVDSEPQQSHQAVSQEGMVPHSLEEPDSWHSCLNTPDRPSFSKQTNSIRKGTEVTGDIHNASTTREHGSSPATQRESVIDEAEDNMFASSTQTNRSSKDSPSLFHGSEDNVSSLDNADAAKKIPDLIMAQPSDVHEVRPTENSITERQLPAATKTKKISIARVEAKEPEQEANTLLKRPTRIRFGNAELHGFNQTPLGETLEKTEEHIFQLEKSLDSSEDEMPEEISAAQGKYQAQTEFKKTTKAVQGQSRQKREKNRKQDARLKEQAGLSKHTSKEHERENKPEAPKYGLSDLLRQDWPEEIPDRVLAAQFSIEKSKHFEPLVKPRDQKKRKFDDDLGRPIKDRRVGATRIRVLPELNRNLPPKVSKASRSLRESWLAGESGGSKKQKLKRRSINKNFIRTETRS